MVLIASIFTELTAAP